MSDLPKIPESLAKALADDNSVGATRVSVKGKDGQTIRNVWIGWNEPVEQAENAPTAPQRWWARLLRRR